MLHKSPDIGVASPMKKRSKERLQNAASPLAEALKSLGSVTTLLKDGEDDNLRAEIQQILDNVNKDVDEGDIVSISEMLCFVEDVGANLEFDIPVLSDWHKVQDWRASFTRAGVSVREMVAFLEVDFSGSLTMPEAPKEDQTT